MKKLIAAAMISAFPLALTPAPLAAAGVTYAAKAPVIELSVYETVQSKPDMATITVGVEANGASAQEALRQNSVEMNRLMDALDTFNIADEDMQTQGLYVNERYEYRNNERVSQGYVANNRLTVKVRQLDQLGRVLDALAGAGATDIGGPQFSIQDDTSVKSEARRRGLDRMLKQAQDYAEWAGYSNVRVIWVTESIQSGDGGYPPPPMPVAARAVNAEASNQAVIAPGEVGTSIQVAAQFEMTR